MVDEQWIIINETSMNNKETYIEIITYSGELRMYGNTFHNSTMIKSYESCVKEQEKTKRIFLILAVILILFAITLLIFAPKGKETLSYIICSVLFIFAAGAAGYKRIKYRRKKGKTPSIEFEADNIK